MTHGQRSAICRLYNAGWRLTALAAFYRMPAPVIEAYLQTRRGYPGQITGPKTGDDTAYTNEPELPFEREAA